MHPERYRFSVPPSVLSRLVRTYLSREVVSLKKKGMYGLTVLVICAITLSICVHGSRAVSVAAIQSVRKKQHRIIIDAGHGGVDGGATSCTGKLESAYNLEIALRLRELFHLLGYPTGMIRTTDTSVYTKGDTIAARKMSDLKERVRIVNETDHNILISIHQNHFPDARYSGAQVFYPDIQGSRELAEAMQDAFVRCLNPGSRRKAKKAQGIYLMEHIENPGILVECGFLSNPEEEYKLNSPEYQKKLCCVIATVTAENLQKEYANT